MKSKLFLLMVSTMLMGASAFAAGVGYIDYGKVQENYPLAQSAIKEIDAKALEIQQYMVDKEKQYKTLDTPLKKQNFEEATAKELQAKEEALLKLKNQKEELVYSRIKEAANKVLVEQNLDAILDFRVMFVGGVDVSDQVIQKLKASK
ncbi:OmpH family outer membrane protein [bacterium]|nr:OmpH family outer membrane protein [bacterium]